MVLDTRQRLTSSPNHHQIVNATSNRPKLCRYNPGTIKSTPRPFRSSISTDPNSYNEIELTSSSPLVPINKLSRSSSSSSSSLVNKLSINQSISIPPTSVYLNSSNGLSSTSINPQSASSSKNHHKRHHGKHHNQHQQLVSNDQQSKCHPIKVHASKSIFLKSSCSKHYVHISGKTVRATQTKSLLDNAFHITSMAIRGTRGHFLVNFKNLLTGKFICFNKKGKIVAKDNGHWDISCLFRESLFSRGVSKYRSFYNDNWLLGFDIKGRPIRGTIKRHGRRPDGSKRRNIAQHCYEFSKIKQSIQTI